MAKTTAIDKLFGEYYFQERMIQKSSNAYVEDLYATPGDSQRQGFIQSEYQAMPHIVRGLARRIADEVLSPWEPR